MSSEAAGDPLTDPPEHPPVPKKQKGRPPGSGQWQDKHCGHQECTNCASYHIERCWKNPHLCPVCAITPGRGLPSLSSPPPPPPTAQPEPQATQPLTRSRKELGPNETPHKDQSKRTKIDRPALSDVTLAAQTVNQRLNDAFNTRTSSIDTKPDSIPTSGRTTKIIKDSIAHLTGRLGSKVRYNIIPSLTQSTRSK